MNDEENEKLDKDERDIMRKSIDDLLNSGVPDEVPGLDNLDKHLPGLSPTRHVNYGDLKEKAEAKAKKIMDSLLKFYLSEEIIDKEEYITAKVELDKMALSSLIYQMDTCERAVTTLLRTIDAGELTPRHFEVLGTLQKTLLDIVKSQTMYMIASEESMKRISRDHDVYKKTINKNNNSDDNSNGLSTRGSKTLMQAIQQMKLEDDIPTPPPIILASAPPVDLSALENYDEDFNSLDDIDDDI